MASPRPRRDRRQPAYGRARRPARLRQRRRRAFALLLDDRRRRHRRPHRHRASSWPRIAVRDRRARTRPASSDARAALRRRRRRSSRDPDDRRRGRAHRRHRAGPRPRSLAAFAAGKPVVTANKELLANHGAELFDGGRRAGVDLLFEAAVAGAIPLIRPLRESLAGERIDRVDGHRERHDQLHPHPHERRGRDYAEALAEAQASGYAERDPTADVEGYDAARQGGHPGQHRLRRRRRRRRRLPGGHHARSSAADIAFAHRLGYAVKLLAVAERVDGGPGRPSAVRVHPAMVPRDHPLAAVAGLVQRRVRRGRGASASSCSTAAAPAAGRRPAPCSATSSTPPTTCRGDAGPRRAPRAGSRSARLDDLRSAVLPEPRRGRPARRAGGRGPGLRRAPRLDPLDGAGRPRRRGPARVPHPHAPARPTCRRRLATSLAELRRRSTAIGGLAAGHRARTSTGRAP